MRKFLDSCYSKPRIDAKGTLCASRHYRERVLIIPKSDYLALVIRKLNSEYVVHLYNDSSGGHYYGDYFKDFDEAKKCYLDRLAGYVGAEKTQEFATQIVNTN